MSPGVMLMLVGDEACREGEKEREGGTGTVKSGRKHTTGASCDVDEVEKATKLRSGHILSRQSLASTLARPKLTLTVVLPMNLVILELAPKPGTMKLPSHRPVVIACTHGHTHMSSDTSWCGDGCVPSSAATCITQHEAMQAKSPRGGPQALGHCYEGTR